MPESVFSDDRPADERGEGRAQGGPLSRLPIILAIGLILIGLVYITRPKPVPVGAPLSDLQLQPLVGDVVPLELSDLAGQVCLINFWGTWCGPCMIEFPELVAMSERLKDDPDFRFIPVSCPPGRDTEFQDLKSATERYYEEKGYELTAHYDPGGVTRLTLVEDLRLRGFNFPTTILLDREGAVQALWVGYNEDVTAQMETEIKNLLR